MIIVIIFGFAMMIVCLQIDKTSRGMPPLFIHIVAWFGIVFGIVGVITIVYRRIKYGKNQVILGEEGLYIHQDFITWAVIHSLAIREVYGGNSYLFIQTSDYKERIAAQSWWKRWQMKFNLKFYGAIYFVSEEWIDCSLEDLMEQCIAYTKVKETPSSPSA